MSVTNAARDIALDALGTAITHLSLHTGYPPDGGNEHAESSGGYERQAVTWAAATSGLMQTASPVVFDTDEDVYWIGGWNAALAGDLLAVWPAGSLTKPAIAREYEFFLTENIIRVRQLWADDDQIVFYGANPPNPLVEGQVYWVVNFGGGQGDFQVAATQGGAPIDLTSLTGSISSQVVARITPNLGGVLRSVTVSSLSLHARF